MCIACTRVAVNSLTMRKPMVIPTQILRPAPNATPCKSSHSNAGTNSPMLNIPARTITSTTMALNSSALASLAPLPSPNTRYPSITRPRAFTVHKFSIATYNN
ncbi:hypothetical protein G4B88_027839 [Cannabis sativa]|uniref:Uncharacterized protein n=1 Tax=Cannabis sativa TaxID=3483 RepID=A0A7J6I7R7_CANSA|nr:hypothetical protein G4B88_027839 [Cannabis sativa]